MRPHFFHITQTIKELTGLPVGFNVGLVVGNGKVGKSVGGKVNVGYSVGGKLVVGPAVVGLDQNYNYN